jgi:hypothetical protein
MVLAQEKVSALVLLILFCAFIYYWMDRSKKGKAPFIRRIPALDAIDEGVGRAAELGRPCIWSPGQAGSMTGSYSGPILTSISIMGYILEKCIEKGVPLISVLVAPEDFAYVSELQLEKYKAVGKTEEFNPDNVIYAPIPSYKIGVLNAITEKDCATTFWIGNHWSTAPIFSEGGAIHGCFQVAWTMDMSNTPYFVMGADYVMISDEGYSAAAYLSDDPELQGGFKGQDWAKYVILIILLLGSALLAAGNSIMLDILGM